MQALGPAENSRLPARTNAGQNTNDTTQKQSERAHATSIRNQKNAASAITQCRPVAAGKPLPALEGGGGTLTEKARAMRE